MQITERKFVLKKIESNGELAVLTISLECDDPDVKNYLLNDCFDGLYLLIENSGYNVYAHIKNGFIKGEIFNETIKDNPDVSMKLMIRNRIGNQTYEYYVNLPTYEVPLSFSRLERFIFVPSDGYDFTFRDEKNLPIQKPDMKSTESTPDVLLKSLHVGKNSLTLKLRLHDALFEIEKSEKLENIVDIDNSPVVLEKNQKTYIPREFCIFWENTKGKERSYFSTFVASEPNVTCSIFYKEIEDAARFLTGDAVFQFYILDDKEKKLPLLSDITEEEKLSIPTKDFLANIYRIPEQTIRINLDGNLYFDLLNVEKDGGSLNLRLDKRSYPLPIIRILAQRVNSENIYELPFKIVRDTDLLTEYKVNMFLRNNDFKFIPGVHQLWVEVQDGIYTPRLPMRLFQERKMRENIFLLMVHPSMVIEGIAHDMGYYTDGTGALKCSILKKIPSVQILKVFFKEGVLYCNMHVKKEPSYDKITSVVLMADNFAKHYPQFKIENENHRFILLSFCVAISQLDFLLHEQSYAVALIFDDNGVPVIIENNLFRPATVGRETQKLSAIYKPADNLPRHIFSDHILGSWRIGISEDLQFAELVEYALENGFVRLDIVIDIMNKVIDSTSLSEQDFSLVLRNLLNEEEMTFDGKRLKDTNIISFLIPTEALSLSSEFFNIPLTTAFLPFIKFNNINISYVSNPMGYACLPDFNNNKKILIRKIDSHLQIDVLELLLYENPLRLEKSNEIIERTRKESSKNTRKIWLIGENYGLSARDNGFAFFEYCMKNIDKTDAEIYYVTKNENLDLNTLAPYMEHVIFYDSEKHLYLDELAEFYIVSHGVRDVLPSIYHKEMNTFHKPIIYLQHGIAAMKKFTISNESYGASIRRFIVSSTLEMLFIFKNKQFWPNEIAITGLARYDNLVNNDNKSYIWISPTYRDWLIKSEKDFLISDFYKYYSDLLSNKKLLNCLRKTNQKILFSFHNDLEKYRSYFMKFENDVVKITDIHSEHLSKRICDCSMMVTDYSSIVFDVIYLEKPAVLFQFDRKEYIESRGCYIDMDTDFPGSIAKNTDEAVNEIIRLIHNDFQVDIEFKRKAERFFDYKDMNNSKRIYEAILDCRKELV